MCQYVAFDNRACFGVFPFVVQKKKKIKCIQKCSHQKNILKEFFVILKFLARAFCLPRTVESV